MSKVVVALSGGVDSSVSAALLQQQGHEVIGMMLRLWSDPARQVPGGGSPTDGLAQARRVAETLGIPFQEVDASALFRDTVVQAFLEGYAGGVTPNPCLVCNRLVKWGVLLEHALALGADCLATGHYARKRQLESGEFQLLRAVDRSKDQSYVLHVLTQEKLARALFPVGEHPKTEIRQVAERLGLPVSSNSESQDLCFLKGEDYREFLRRNAPAALSKPGPLLTREGRQIGEHQGLAFYTIGQRKGLGAGFPRPIYVLEKDVAANALIVGEASELGGSSAVAEGVNWVSGSAPSHSIRAEIKSRYTAREAWGEVTPLDGGRVEIRFDSPQRDLTPGQAAVFYDGEVVLGGGILVGMRVANISG